MNEAQIEQRLRNSPRLRIPARLEEKLRENIRLPCESTSGALDVGFWFQWKRWLPLTLCLAFALTALSMQFFTLSRLKSENTALQSATQNLEQLRRDHAEYKKLLTAGEDLDRLRRDHAELLSLRNEVIRLRTETADLERLQRENQTLGATVAVNTEPATDYFAEAQARAERIACVNNLKQLGLAARIWANDHEEVYPKDFISMKDEMGTPKILKCPSDKARGELTWTDVAAGNVSYQANAWGIHIDSTPPSTVFSHCSIHHNYGLIDGSVQMLSPERLKTDLTIINGRLTLKSR